MYRESVTAAPESGWKANIFNAKKSKRGGAKGQRPRELRIELFLEPGNLCCPPVMHKSQESSAVDQLR